MLKYSVCICTYNGARYIEEQLKSILSQKREPSEIIISDDGSTDDTIKIIERFFLVNTFKDYKIVDGPNNGPAQNFIKVLEYAKYDIIFFSDQDDIWCSNKVCRYLEHVQLNVPQLIYSDSTLFHDFNYKDCASFMDSQQLTNNILFDDSILITNCVQGATICLNRKLIELHKNNIKFFDQRKILMHDWYLSVLAKYYGKVTYINEPLIYYRQHDNNVVGAKNKVSSIIDALNRADNISKQTLLFLGGLNKLTHKKIIDIKEIFNLKFRYVKKIKLLLVYIFILKNILFSKNY